MDIIFGTRPEAIKLGCVVAELRALDVKPRCIATGQHWDLLRGTPAESDLADSYSLGLPAKADPQRWISLAIPLIAHHLEGPLVVVQGDTASALAGARAAHERGFAVAHIEAGVRSGNLEEPCPEEAFRREITQLATIHYAPTSTCYANLIAEGVDHTKIRITGNPVVSALQRYANAKPQPPGDHVVLTMHRREWLQWVDLPVWLGELAEACLDHPRLNIVWPVHPAVRAKWPHDWTNPKNLWIDPPLPYREMVDLLSRAKGLATDSGGLVEEAATLGIPTAILRNANDRPEAVEAGVARQFAPSNLRDALNWLATDLARTPSAIYGTPDAACEIARDLVRREAFLAPNIAVH